MTESTGRATEQDYILGTHDAEVERLGLQHRVWRAQAWRAWQSAGFATGATLLDVGCGPGWASLDLAELVGRSGRVIAVDRARRFLDVLVASAARRGMSWIEPHEVDLDAGALPLVAADGAFTRWVYSFVRRPQALLHKVAGALRPGAAYVIHEYFDYASWRLAPRSAPFEHFVQTVMKSWRSEGGEPDIALSLLGWLDEAGFEVRSLRPILEVVRPGEFWWQWPHAFVETGVRRLVDLGFLAASEGEQTTRAFAAAEANPSSVLFTPAVLEIIAVRRGPA